MLKHTRRVVALGAAALVTAIAVSGCSLQPDISTRLQGGTHTNTPAPAVSGTTLTGARLDLASLRGHPVVVDFWGSWCGPCRAAQAELNSLVTRYAARGVQFVGVDMRDDRANALAYVQQFHVAYPSIFDPASDVSASFDVASPPVTVVIDKSGSIRLRELATFVDVPATLDSLLGSQ